MPTLKQEIETLRAGGASERAIGNLKAQRIVELVGSGPISYVYNGVLFNLSNIGFVVQNGVGMIQVTMTARQAPSGPFIITANDLMNPMHFQEPIFWAANGSENLAEGLRRMLASKVREKLGA